MDYRVRYNPSYPKSLPVKPVAIGLAALLVGIWLIVTVVYMVEADSEGVVLRFGRYQRSTPPGLHLKLPWPIESRIVIPVQQVQSLEYGFATARPGVRTEYVANNKAFRTVAEMLTADLNLAHVEWIVQYRIKDAYRFLYKVGGAGSPQAVMDEMIHAVSESVMRGLVGDASVDEVITIGRDQIAMDAQLKIQEMLDRFETGVEIVTVKLQSASPPEEVKDAFDEVNRARQKKERVINEAMGERNQQIPAARGQRDRQISEAEGYREKRVRTMQGQVNAFLSQAGEYDKAPEITRTRLYLETMEAILAGAPEITILDSQIQGIVPLLNLGQPTAAGPQPQPQPQNPAGQPVSAGQRSNP